MPKFWLKAKLAPQDLDGSRGIRRAIPRLRRGKRMAPGNRGLPRAAGASKRISSPPGTPCRPRGREQRIRAIAMAHCPTMAGRTLRGGRRVVLPDSGMQP